MPTCHVKIGPTAIGAVILSLHTCDYKALLGFSATLLHCEYKVSHIYI